MDKAINVCKTKHDITCIVLHSFYVSIHSILMEFDVASPFYGGAWTVLKYKAILVSPVLEQKAQIYTYVTVSPRLAHTSREEMLLVTRIVKGIMS